MKLHFLKMESKRKLQTRTLTEKYDILKEIDNGKKCATAIRDYNVPKQTYGWMKDKKEIYEEVEASRVLAIKTSLYRDPFSNLKPCILQRNLV